MNEYQGNTSLHEGAHAACCILFEIPFQRLTIIPGRGENGKKFAGCLTYRDEPEPRWYIYPELFFEYPKDETAGLGARTVLAPLTEEERRWSIRHCIVSFAGAVIEELDPYGPGKHTSWGPTQDFKDIRQRLEYMGWLDKNQDEQEEQFQELFNFTRNLFKDKQGDKTALWKRSVEIGKVLWRMKKLSEGECRKIYNDYKESHDKRYKVPEPWPLLRKNI